EDIDEAASERTAKAAYAALLGPLASDLAGKEKLVVVPDGDLFGVPFEALMPNGAEAERYLVEHHVISYHLSLALLHESLGRKGVTGPRGRLLLLGDPTLPDQSTLPPLRSLPGAKREIAGVAHVFGPERAVTHTGEQARKDILLRNSEGFSILHLATHGVANERFPWQSRLMFSGVDGQLSLMELGTVRLSADLVVLSACETG